MITEIDIREEYYDNAGASKKLNIGGERIRQLCSEGRFEGAFKLNGGWLIPKEAVNNFQRKPRGFPKGTHRRTDKAKQEVTQWLEAAGYGGNGN